MSPMKRYAIKQAKSRTRRRLKAQQHAQDQLYIEAIHQALIDLDFPDTLVAKIEGRLQTQHQLLGKIVGLMFPTLSLAADIAMNSPAYADGTRISPHSYSGREFSPILIQTLNRELLIRL